MIKEYEEFEQDEKSFGDDEKSYNEAFEQDEKSLIKEDREEAKFIAWLEDQRKYPKDHTYPKEPTLSGMGCSYPRELGWGWLYEDSVQPWMRRLRCSFYRGSKFHLGLTKYKKLKRGEPIELGKYKLGTIFDIKIKSGTILIPAGTPKFPSAYKEDISTKSSKPLVRDEFPLTRSAKENIKIVKVHNNFCKYFNDLEYQRKVDRWISKTPGTNTKKIKRPSELLLKPGEMYSGSDGLTKLIGTGGLLPAIKKRGHPFQSEYQYYNNTIKYTPESEQAFKNKRKKIEALSIEDKTFGRFGVHYYHGANYHQHWQNGKLHDWYNSPEPCTVRGELIVSRGQINGKRREKFDDPAYLPGMVIEQTPITKNRPAGTTLIIKSTDTMRTRGKSDTPYVDMKLRRMLTRGSISGESYEHQEEDFSNWKADAYDSGYQADIPMGGGSGYSPLKKMKPPKYRPPRKMKSEHLDYKIYLVLSKNGPLNLRTLLQKLHAEFRNTNGVTRDALVNAVNRMVGDGRARKDKVNNRIIVQAIPRTKKKIKQKIDVGAAIWTLLKKGDIPLFELNKEHGIALKDEKIRSRVKTLVKNKKIHVYISTGARKEEELISDWMDLVTLRRLESIKIRPAEDWDELKQKGKKTQYDDKGKTIIALDPMGIVEFDEQSIARVLEGTPSEVEGTFVKDEGEVHPRWHWAIGGSVAYFRGHYEEPWIVNVEIKEECYFCGHKWYKSQSSHCPRCHQPNIKPHKISIAPYWGKAITNTGQD
jgi:hypothetical protein